MSDTAKLAPAPVAVAQPVTAGSARPPAKAVICVLASAFGYAATDAMVKWMSRSYPVLEITFFRNIFTFLPVAWIVWQGGGFRSLRSERMGLHIVRAVLGTVAMVLYFVSYSLMPLANVTAVGSTAPLILVVMARLFLGEKVGAKQWAAIGLGFLGALIVIGPSISVFQWLSVLPLAASIAFAGYMLFIRVLSATESQESLIFYVPLVAAGISGCAMPWVWTPIDAFGLAMMAIMGVGAGFALYFRNIAYSMIQANVGAPLEYTNLLWAACLGIVFFGDEPTWNLVVGALVIVSSNLYVVWQRRPHSPMRAAAPRPSR
jgi:drug/metabolite transporter (DMT)-like permease